MTNEQTLIAEINNLPEHLKSEAVDAALRLIKALARQKADASTAKHPRRRAGSRPGMFVMASNFDDPIQGFEDYM